MRKRFEPQLLIGQLPISETPVPLKCRDSLARLIAALKEIFTNEEWNEKVFAIFDSI